MCRPTATSGFPSLWRPRAIEGICGRSCPIPRGNRRWRKTCCWLQSCKLPSRLASSSQRPGDFYNGDLFCAVKDYLQAATKRQLDVRMLTTPGIKTVRSVHLSKPAFMEPTAKPSPTRRAIGQSGSSFLISKAASHSPRWQDPTWMIGTDGFDGAKINSAPAHLFRQRRLDRQRLLRAAPKPKRPPASAIKARTKHTQGWAKPGSSFLTSFPMVKAPV